MLLEDEQSLLALDLATLSRKAPTIYVPAHWWVELTNGLLRAERRKRTVGANISEAFNFAEGFPVTIDDETSFRCPRQTIQLARRHNLSVYDAAYLELAIRRESALATLDGALARAAKSAGVALLL